MARACLPYPLTVVVLAFSLVGSPLMAKAAQPNYDPPQPSLEFGTPSLTPTISKDPALAAILAVASGVPNSSEGCGGS